METKTILIVDDEDSVLFVLKNSLARLGNNYRILTAKDGISALRLFGQYQIDLAITDYRMNEMTGLELLELIHNVQPATKVIFITAFGSDELEAQVTNLNAFAYLKKPLDLNTFRSIVLQALGDLANSNMGLIIQDDDINHYVENSLQLIKNKISARALLVLNYGQNAFISVGDIEKSKREQLAAFINTSLSILKKAGNLFDGDNLGSDWLIHHGTREDILAGRVDNNHLIIAILEDRSGSFGTKQVLELLQSFSTDLKKKFALVAKKEKEKIFGQGFNQAVQSELDKLFSPEPAEKLETIKAQMGIKPDQNPSGQFTMSYEEALAVGLILPIDMQDESDNG